MRISVYNEKKLYNFNFGGWLLKKTNKEKSGEEVQYKFVHMPKSSSYGLNITIWWLMIIAITIMRRRRRRMKRKTCCSRQCGHNKSRPLLHTDKSFLVLAAPDVPDTTTWCWNTQSKKRPKKVTPDNCGTPLPFNWSPSVNWTKKWIQTVSIH